MGAPLSGLPPKLRVLPRPDLQASHLGGSLETSFENYLWIRGGWLIRACSHSGYQALVAPIVPCEGACATGGSPHCTCT